MAIKKSTWKILMFLEEAGFERIPGEYPEEVERGYVCTVRMTATPKDGVSVMQIGITAPSLGRLDLPPDRDEWPSFTLCDPIWAVGKAGFPTPFLHPSPQVEADAEPQPLWS